MVGCGVSVGAEVTVEVRDGNGVGVFEGGVWLKTAGETPPGLDTAKLQAWSRNRVVTIKYKMGSGFLFFMAKPLLIKARRDFPAQKIIAPNDRRT
jgi:hypothetical protein